MGDHSEVHIDEIKAVNHHLRLAVDQISEGVVIVEPTPLSDQGPTVLFANEAILEITGITREQLVGEQFSKIYPGESLGLLFSHLEAALVSGITLPIDSGIRLADSSTRPCHWTAQPVRDPEGKPLSIIFTVKPELDAATLAEPTRHPKQGKAPKSTVPPPLPPTAPLFSQGKDILEERGDASQTSGPKPATADLQPVGNSQPLPISNPAPNPKPQAARGINGSHPQTDEYLERNRLESLAMLAGGIAHDFRNSLTAIIANLSLAKPLSEPGTELEQHLEDVETAAEGARELTSHLLAFARGGKPKREATDVSRLVKESIQLATYGASVKCRITMDDDLWHSEVDPTQIKQVLNNLIINAWQAMPGGGTIRITAENARVTDTMNVDVRPGQYVALAVRDRGCGIAESNIRKIFEPFFTTKSSGSGIGLATCYRVIKQHDGDITVRSKEHVGTEFKVFIPACRPCAQKKKPTGKSGRDDLIMGTGDILVVDDQRSIRSVATMILKKLGYSVQAAADGETAVRMYDSARKDGKPFAAVLMDMTLPGGMNGEETFQEIRRIDPQTRVIASSGFFEDDAYSTFRNLGFVSILPKPYSASVLSKILDESIHAPAAS